MENEAKTSWKSYGVKPMTDVSSIKMEDRRCEHCGIHFRVKADSKQKIHNTKCAELNGNVKHVGFGDFRCEK